MNYARHIKTGRTVFFRDKPPEDVTTPSHWVCWTLPAGDRYKAFHVVGEGKDDYCLRNSHVPRCCMYCIRAKIRPLTDN